VQHLRCARSLIFSNKQDGLSWTGYSVVTFGQAKFCGKRWYLAAHLCASER
jgi:hypothetical protein